MRREAREQKKTREVTEKHDRGAREYFLITQIGASSVFWEFGCSLGRSESFQSIYQNTKSVFLWIWRTELYFVDLNARSLDSVAKIYRNMDRMQHPLSSISKICVFLNNKSGF
jgi:hypothetical protein